MKQKDLMILIINEDSDTAAVWTASAARGTCMAERGGSMARTDVKVRGNNRGVRSGGSD